jgi:hypothetical protein
MATFVELRTDSFADVLSELTTSHRLDFENVRRPFRGIEIKEDTYAIIKVIRSNGKEIPLTDAGSRITGAGVSGRKKKNGDYDFGFPDEGSTFNYSNFVAQTIVEARQEKSQVVETFGDPYIFFYGEKPRVLNVQGLLMNTLDFNWKNEFLRNYEKYLRGTKLVEHKARVYLYYDDQIVEGYILDTQIQMDANLPYHVPFNFTLFVTSHTYIGLIESNGMYPVSANVNISPDSLTDKLNVDETIRKLRDRAEDLRPDELISTIEDVRFASEMAAGGVLGKDAIMSAVISGMSDFEALTNAFLSNVKTYFYGRRTVVPRGFLGSERTVGEATYANTLTFVGEPPQRVRPLRSRISDNYDEYVGGKNATLSLGSVEDDLESQENEEDYDYELQMLSELEALGVDISDPTPAQELRGRLTHTIVETAGKVDFAAGIANGVMGNVKSKVNQIAQVGSGLPSKP